MSPQVILLILTFALRYGPEAAKAIRGMFTKPSGVAPTDEEWEKVWSLIKKPYGDYIADAQAELGLGPTPPTPTPHP